jgi:2-polyprenyl-6-methoxyphenol hydroxylase-like FAD-dependent oxidoreductase
MRVAVVGGGPGGLLLAALLRKADSSVEVTVFERGRADETWGFGVVFSDHTLAGFLAADPLLAKALDEPGVRWDTIEIRLKGERLRCGGNGMSAIVRRDLLRILQQRARDLGADLRFSTSVSLDDLGGYDLVVAADGTGSAIRESLEPAFGSTLEPSTVRFIWCGTDYHFDGLTFVHERGPHGVFAVHGYPISPEVSTFIVETDETSWRAAGLDEFDVSAPPGPSDEKTRSYLQELFADQLDGHQLLVNNSRWGTFRTRRTARWSTLNPRPVVLLGDAAHTAHFSVGSGTKMAMEDAVVLAGALTAHPGDVPAALTAYEQAARPSVEKIQGSARPSLSWWEHFGRYHDTLEPWQFAYHFLSRSITDARLARRDSGFVAATKMAWVKQFGAEPLQTPLTVGQTTFPSRLINDVPAGTPDVEAPPSEAGLAPVLGALQTLVAAGAPLLAVHGGSPLTRRLVCEQIRLVHGRAALLVDRDLDQDGALTSVLSGRADLVVAGPSALAGLSALAGPAALAGPSELAGPGTLAGPGALDGLGAR